MLCADLHIHTTISDGTCSPTEIVTKASELGLVSIAITDHDSVNGIAEAKIAARHTDIEVIAGIELSSLWGDNEVHILGYFIDISNKDLRHESNILAQARRQRAERMVRKLNKLGIAITYERVKELANSDVIGRPHIAQAMLEKGYIQNIQQAFSRAYIDKGGRAYVERYKLKPKSAIQLITQAGGVAVIAHPGSCCRGEGLSEGMIRQLVNWGLHGVEVYHSSHSEGQQEEYRKIAQKLDLLVTGGSDFHGSSKDEGYNLGDICLPYKYVKALKAKALALV